MITNSTIIDRCQHARLCDDEPPHDDVYFHEPEYMIAAARRLIKAAKCRENYTVDRSEVADNLYVAFCDLEDALDSFFEFFPEEERSLL